ncbi:MAG: VOC family protein [Acidobacteria bacterium]|nr:VOC family protein [Acidobacteriota bacterium]
MIAIDSLVSAFESGRLTRRQLVHGLAALVGAASASDAAAQAPAIPALSLNHVSLAVADPEASKQFFQRTFGMPVVSTQGTGINLALGTSFLGLYKMPNPGRVDHVCFGVDHYDVNAMAAKLEAQGIKATIRKDKPEVYFTDPDGIRFQLENKDYRG